MLHVTHLKKLYKNEQGITGVSFTLEKGQVCAVVGHNGSGKTTLFKTLSGLLHPDKGTIVIKTNKQRRLAMGYLPENRSVIADMETVEFITFFGKLKGMSDTMIIHAMQQWMTFLDCDDLRGKKLRQCSKGNQQKIQMISCLIHDPDILILDEPFSGLDIDNTRLFEKLIIHLKKQEKCILLSSHRFEEIEHLCDMLMVLKASHVVIEGSLKQIRDAADSHTVTLSNDPHMSFRNEKGVCDVIVDGNLTHYYVVSEASCTRLMQAILKERDHRTVKVASLMLRDLVRSV